MLEKDKIEGIDKYALNDLKKYRDKEVGQKIELELQMAANIPNEKTTGYLYEMLYRRVAIHRQGEQGWQVTDIQTGLGIENIPQGTRKEALKAAIEKVERKGGVEGFKKAIHKQLKANRDKQLGRWV